ncbi:hypothetical protein D3C84_377610 [compost metagenome]
MGIAKVDAEILPGKGPLISRRQPSLIQLQPLRASNQRHQQVLTVVAQARFQITLHALFKQPQAGVRQHQADDQHHADQPQAQTPLDRFHRACPPNR